MSSENHEGSDSGLDSNSLTMLYQLCVSDAEKKCRLVEYKVTV